MHDDEKNILSYLQAYLYYKCKKAYLYFVSLSLQNGWIEFDEIWNRDSLWIRAMDYKLLFIFFRSLSFIFDLFFFSSSFDLFLLFSDFWCLISSSSSPYSWTHGWNHVSRFLYFINARIKSRVAGVGMYSPQMSNHNKTFTNPSLRNQSRRLWTDLPLTE